MPFDEVARPLRNAKGTIEAPAVQRLLSIDQWQKIPGQMQAHSGADRVRFPGWRWVAT